MARTTALEKERSTLEANLALTGAVQKFFLPKSFDDDHPTLRFSGDYHAAQVCGGDWVHYERPSADSLTLLIGDVTGHGAAAAMITAAAASRYGAFRQLMPGASLKEAFLDLNRYLRELAAGEYQMTLTGFTLDARAMTLVGVTAGAPPCFLLRQGKLQTLTAPSTPLGDENFVIGDLATALEPHDRLVVFTDGISELELDNGRQLGLKGLSKLMLATAAMPVRAARDSVVSSLKSTLGARAPADDLTLAMVDVERA